MIRHQHGDRDPDPALPTRRTPTTYATATATDELDRPRPDRRPSLDCAPPRAPRAARHPRPRSCAGSIGTTCASSRSCPGRLFAGPAAETPVLADAAVMAHLDIDSTQRRVFGQAEEGAGSGWRRSALHGAAAWLNPLLAAVSAARGAQAVPTRADRRPSRGPQGPRRPVPRHAGDRIADERTGGAERSRMARLSLRAPARAATALTPVRPPSPSADSTVTALTGTVAATRARKEPA
jgi:hypothetical protein